jgi:hydroxymethylglutaryl-CoA lyase
MATDDLTGNMPTEEMISYFNSENLGINIDNSEFQKSMMMALNVFPNK